MSRQSYHAWVESCLRSNRHGATRRRSTIQSRPFHRQLRVELLEKRQMLSGTTIVTHGFLPGDDPSAALPLWVDSMANEISNLAYQQVSIPGQTPRQTAQYEMTLTKTGLFSTGVTGWGLNNGYDPGPGVSAYNLSSLEHSNGEAVIVLNWSALAFTGVGVSEATTQTIADAAAQFLFTELESLGPALLASPIHLIGHSRGASVMGALAKEFGERGVAVDQVTFLDAHPILGDYGNGVFDNIGVTKNVVFADSYYRTGNVSAPNGESVDGAYNSVLSNYYLGGDGIGYGGLFNQHSDVHLWYQGTIDTQGGISDGDETLDGAQAAAWYSSVYGMPGPRNETGYHFSRVLGGSRTGVGPLEGLHPDIYPRDNRHNRDDVTLTDAAWANVVEFRLKYSNTVFLPGESIQFDYYYQDRDDFADIDFFLDNDSNPYNNAAGALPLGHKDLYLKGPGFSYDTFDWNTAGTNPGRYFVYAKAYDDDGHVRYTYALQQVIIDDHGVDAATATALGLGVIKEGAISSTSDRDWFKFSLQAGHNYQVDLINPGSGALKLRVYGQDGRTLINETSVSNGYSGVGLNPVATTGTYFASVEGINGAQGVYAVTVNESAVTAVDLIVESVSVPPAAQIGSTLSLPTQIRNISSQATTSPTVIRYVLLSGATQIPLGDLPVPVLAGNQELVLPAVFSISGAVPPGAYTVRATIDPDNVVPEASNSNNVFVGQGTIAISSAPPALPDLAATALINPGTAVRGEPFNITLQVTNNSTVPSPASQAVVTIKQVPSVQVGTVSIPPLAAYETRALVAPVTIPSSLATGIYSLRADVNPAGAGHINESFSGNNSILGATSITVSASALKPDLTPVIVTNPSTTVMTNGSLQITVSIKNIGTAASDPYSVEFVFSQDQFVSGSDRLATTVSRPGIAIGAIDKFITTVSVPSGLAAGSYYVGVRVDPANNIGELSDTNNSAVAPRIVQIVEPGATGDLTSLGYHVSPSALTWGGTVTVTHNLRNDGSGVFPESTVQYIVSDDASFPAGATTVIAASTFGPLNPGYGSGGNSPIILPGTKPGNIVGSSLYLGIRVNGEVLDYSPITITEPVPQTANDLVGIDFDARPTAVIGWGDPTEFDIRFKNQGTQAITGGFYNAIYLSHDAVFDASDRLVHEYHIGNLISGAIIGTTERISLPSNPPPGFSSTEEIYFLHVVDNRNLVNEGTAEGNNSGQGTGIDRVKRILTQEVIDDGRPVIGNFSLTPTTIVRGGKFDMLATNVVDDLGVVNDLFVYYDSNNNGNWDEADQQLYIFNLSRSGTTWTGRIDSTQLPVGNDRLFALARDGNLQYSKPFILDVVVQGVGTAVPDAYEANDVRSQAVYLGSHSTTIDHLSITPGDHDWFVMAPYFSAKVTVRIDFFQEDGPGIDPGDLALEVYRQGDTQPIADPNTSHPGSTFEQAVISNIGAPFEIHVYGNSPNNDYRLIVSFEPIAAGSPTIQSLDVSPGIVRPEGQVTLTIRNAQAFGGATIREHYFFVDLNRNHINDFGAEELGSGASGPGVSDYQVTKPVVSWGVGTFEVFSQVVDTQSRRSLVAVSTVQIVPNQLPTIDLLEGPATAVSAQSFILTARGVVDSDGATTPVVNFRVDVDQNGEPSAGDILLSGTRSVSGSDVAFTVDPWSLGSGTFSIIATPFDGEGNGLSVGTTVEIIQPLVPMITVSSIDAPDQLREGLPLIVGIRDVNVPGGGTPTVRVYGDTSGNGQLNAAGDNVLAIGTGIGNSDYVAMVPSTLLPNGMQVFFIEVSANGASSYVQQLLINVIRNNPASLAPISDRQIAVGETLTVSVFGFDADGDTILYSIENGPNGAAIDSLTGIVTWTPSSDVPSDDAIFTIGVRDAFGVQATDTESFMVHVSVPDIPFLAGDYSRDGTVDNQDYDVWRASFGNTGTGQQADGSGNGSVGSEDYGVWRAHFGLTTVPTHTISGARQQPLGSIVTVAGVVTTTTDLVDSTGFRNFFIQDATGGIAIFGTTSQIQALLSGITEGDSVAITGTTDAYSGSFELDGTAGTLFLVKTGHPGIPQPTPVTTTALADLSSQAESLEGMLVKLSGVSFVGTGTFAGAQNYTVTDGVTQAVVRVSTTQQDIVGTAIPTGPVNLVGVLSQFDSTAPSPGPGVPGEGYELLLRTVTDIVSSGAGAGGGVENVASAEGGRGSRQGANSIAMSPTAAAEPVAAGVFLQPSERSSGGVILTVGENSFVSRSETVTPRGWRGRVSVEERIHRDDALLAWISSRDGGQMEDAGKRGDFGDGLDSPFNDGAVDDALDALDSELLALL